MNEISSGRELLSLPNELLNYMAFFLDSKTRITVLSFVCKRLKEISDDWPKALRSQFTCFVTFKNEYDNQTMIKVMKETLSVFPGLKKKNFLNLDIVIDYIKRDQHLASWKLDLKSQTLFAELLVKGGADIDARNAIAAIERGDGQLIELILPIFKQYEINEEYKEDKEAILRFYRVSKIYNRLLSKGSSEMVKRVIKIRPPSFLYVLTLLKRGHIALVDLAVDSFERECELKRARLDMDGWSTGEDEGADFSDPFIDFCQSDTPQIAFNSNTGEYYLVNSFEDKSDEELDGFDEELDECMEVDTFDLESSLKEKKLNIKTQSIEEISALLEEGVLPTFGDFIKAIARHNLPSVQLLIKYRDFKYLYRCAKAANAKEIVQFLHQRNPRMWINGK